MALDIVAADLTLGMVLGNEVISRNDVLAYVNDGHYDDMALLRRDNIDNWMSWRSPFLRDGNKLRRSGESVPPCTILYSHGNGQSVPALAGWGGLPDYLRKLSWRTGCNVFAYEYLGYGGYPHWSRRADFDEELANVSSTGWRRASSNRRRRLSSSPEEEIVVTGQEKKHTSTSSRRRSSRDINTFSCSSDNDPKNTFSSDSCDDPEQESTSINYNIQTPEQQEGTIPAAGDYNCCQPRFLEEPFYFPKISKKIPKISKKFPKKFQKFVLKNFQRIAQKIVQKIVQKNCPKIRQKNFQKFPRKISSNFRG